MPATAVAVHGTVKSGRLEDLLQRRGALSAEYVRGTQMAFGLEIIGLAAAGTFAATLGVAARLYGRAAVAAPAALPQAKSALHVAVAAERAASKRCMVPEKVALQVVEYLRAEGLNSYPLIPDDLDEAINYWCDDAGVERVSTQHVRELIAVLPGVYRDRIRLSTNSPKHRSVRNRLQARGRTIGEKATVYLISDGPIVRSDIPCDTPCDTHPVGVGEGGSDIRVRPKSDRTKTTARPTPGRSGRTSDRTYVSDDHQAWPSDVRRRAAA